MIYEGTAGSDPFAIAATFIAVGVTTVAAYVILRLGHRILRNLGRVGVMAVTRVMGLLLAAVAVQFIVDGILGIAPHV